MPAHMIQSLRSSPQVLAMALTLRSFFRATTGTVQRQYQCCCREPPISGSFFLRNVNYASWNLEGEKTMQMFGRVDKEQRCFFREAHSGRDIQVPSFVASTAASDCDSSKNVSTAAVPATVALEERGVPMSVELHDEAKEQSLGDGRAGLMQTVVLKALEKALGSPLETGPQTPPSKPLVIVISGPSGVGKDAVIKRLQEVRPDLHFVVTATTRPQRPGEVHGQDYFFISKDEFGEMIQENELLEHALVYGDYKGIPKKQVREAMARGTDVVLRLDVQGAATVRAILGINAVFIFLVAESEVALVKRLVERKTESMEKVLIRIRTAREELKRLKEFDYVVVNSHGQLERAVQTVCAIIEAEKSRACPRIAVL